MTIHFEQNAGQPRFRNHGMRVFVERDPRNPTRVSPVIPLFMRDCGRRDALLISQNAASNTQTRPPIYMGGGALLAVWQGRQATKSGAFVC
jgi:hypothetical protein